MSRHLRGHGFLALIWVTGLLPGLAFSDPETFMWTSPVRLERPQALARDVEFWRRVFGEVSNDEGLIHDDQRLDIVYEIVQLPERHSNADRQRAADAAARKYGAILRRLAGGRRSALSADEKRVLALWGADTSAATLRTAAGRVRFQLGQADRFREGLIRSGRWESYIARTLASYEIPPELLALPHVESGFNPAARSHAGAAGLWQFMSGTARDFIHVDGAVDERLDPYRATDAAARLLQRNFRLTGTWPTAITAYNHGAGGMQQAARQVGTTDIDVIVRKYRGRAFGFASRNFYVSLLAAIDVRANAERYFGRIEREPAEQLVILTTPDYAPIEKLEQVLGVDRATLASFNPSLGRSVLDGAKYVPRGHPIYLPVRPGVDPQALLAAVPSQTWAKTQVADRFHVVRRGETLSMIAPRYGVRIADLVAANSLRSANTIRVGQHLVLPVAGSVAAKGGGRSMSGAAVKVAHTQTQAKTNSQTNSETAARPSSVPVVSIAMVTEEGAVVKPAREIDVPIDPADYAVRPDGSINVLESETLGLYAEWLAVPVGTLRRHNGLPSSGGIRVGGTLRLPLATDDHAAFEALRLAYHRGIRDAFLAQHRIEGTHEHRVRPGESAWTLAERRYRIPVWLLSAYNPGLDLAMVRPGQRVVIPRVSR